MTGFTEATTGEKVGKDRTRPRGDVWSLAAHPHDPSVMFAGYDRSVICRSVDAGASWQSMNTANVIFPHISMHPREIVKRVIGISVDPGNPDDVYGAVEVGGLVASRDGGETWVSATDGHYTSTSPVDLHGVQVNPSAPGPGVHHHPKSPCSAAANGDIIGSWSPWKRCSPAAPTAGG